MVLYVLFFHLGRYGFFLQDCMLSVLILVANFDWLNDASYYLQYFHCQALNVDKWARVNQQPCWYLHLFE